MSFSRTSSRKAFRERPRVQPHPRAVTNGWRKTADWLFAHPFRQYFVRPALRNEAGRGDFERAIVVVHLCWWDPPAFEQVFIAASYAEAEHYADDRGEGAARRLLDAVNSYDDHPHLLRRDLVIFDTREVKLRALRAVHGLAPPAQFVVDNWYVDADTEYEDKALTRWRQRAFAELPAAVREAREAAAQVWFDSTLYGPAVAGTEIATGRAV